MFNRKKDRPDVELDDDLDVLVEGDEPPDEVRATPPPPPAPTQRRPPASPASGAPFTRVGQGVTLEGTLRFVGGASIQGNVRGRVISAGRLEVGPEAQVFAEVDVGALVVRGVVRGNVKAAETVEIHETGELRGDLRTPALTVETGALFHGRCDMGKER